MSRTAIVAISRRGAALARALASSLSAENTLYLELRLLGPEDGAASGFDLPLRPLIRQLFDQYQALVLFMSVGVFQEAGEPDWWPEDRPLPDNITVFDSFDALAEAPVAAALVITDRLTPGDGCGSYQEALGGKILILYRPRSLAVGMGCRRGVPLEELEGLLLDTLQRSNLSTKSLSCIATADLKQDEPGILALAEKYSIPVICYSGEELNAVFEQPGEAIGNSAVPPTPSEKAYSLLGIWGVSEPAALLASGSRELLVPRLKTSRATIAVARKRF